MKRLFLSLTLAITFSLITITFTQQTDSASTNNEWTEIPIETAQSDPEIKNAIDFGAQAVANRAYQAGVFNGVAYILTSVLSVQKQVVSDTSVNYNITLVLEDQESDKIITTSYLLSLQPSSSSLWQENVESEVGEEEEVGSGSEEWVDVDITKTESDFSIKAALNLGAIAVVSRCAEFEDITVLDDLKNDYQFTQISLVRQKAAKGGKYYDFHIEILAKFLPIRGYYTIFVDSKKKIMRVAEYLLTLRYNNDGSNVRPDAGINLRYEAETDGGNGAIIYIIKKTNKSGVSVAEGWDVYTSDYQRDEDVKSTVDELVNTFAHEFITRVTAAGMLRSGNWEVLEVTRVDYQESRNSYRLEMQMTDANDVILIEFEVQDDGITSYSLLSTVRP